MSVSVSFRINDHEVRSQLLKQIYALRQHPHVVVSGTYRDLPTVELLHLSEDLTAALKEFENTSKRTIHNQIKVDKFINAKYRHRKSEDKSANKKVVKTHNRTFLGKPVITTDLIPTSSTTDPVRSLRGQVRTSSFAHPAPFISLEHLLQEGEELATVTSTLPESSMMPDVLFLKRHEVATKPEPITEGQNPVRNFSAQLSEPEVMPVTPDQDPIITESSPPVRYFVNFDEDEDHPPPPPAASHEEVMNGTRVQLFNNLPVTQLSGSLVNGTHFNTPFLDLSSFLQDGEDLTSANLDQVGPYLNPHTEVRPGLLDIVVSDLSGHIIVENASNQHFDQEVSEHYSEATSRLGDDHLFVSDEE